MPRVPFTSETAKRASALGHAARWGNRMAKSLAPAPTPLPDDYLAKRLSRVRAQLDLVDKLLSEERDPQKLDRLAAASSRLCDQEFALAGRPKPGQRRPGPERPIRPPSVLPLPVPEATPAATNPGCQTLPESPKLEAPTPQPPTQEQH